MFFFSVPLCHPRYASCPRLWRQRGEDVLKFCSDTSTWILKLAWSTCNIAKHSHFSPLKATVCMQVKASDWQDGGEGQTGPGHWGSCWGDEVENRRWKLVFFLESASNGKISVQHVVSITLNWFKAGQKLINTRLRFPLWLLIETLSKYWRYRNLQTALIGEQEMAESRKSQFDSHSYWKEPLPTLSGVRFQPI